MHDYFLSERETLRVRRPRYYLFPEGWRTRIADLEADIAQAGPISTELLHVRNAPTDPEAQARLAQLVEANKELFPGEAGSVLAWAIACDEPPAVRRLDHDGGEREIFMLPTPPYSARLVRSKRNMSTKRRLRTEDRYRKILSLLAGSPECAPLTFKAAADELGITPRELSRHLSYMRSRLGVNIPTAGSAKSSLAFHEDQKSVVALIRSWPRRERFDLDVYELEQTGCIGCGRKPEVADHPLEHNGWELDRKKRVVRCPVHSLARLRKVLRWSTGSTRPVPLAGLRKATGYTLDDLLAVNRRDLVYKTSNLDPEHPGAVEVVRLPDELLEPTGSAN